MQSQKESKAVWFIAVLAILCIFSLRCFASDVVREPDCTFLYNRCYQMWDCMCHGYYPFLYYNDLGGIGYASPIFYGQLTLVPFIPFLTDIGVFLKVYYFVSLMLNFFGFRVFAGRFSSYGSLSACFYIVGLPFIFLSSSSLYAAILATGISMFFFAFCVDFFRDGKSLPLLILTYFLIWQANLNSAILATAVCFGLFVIYFRADRIRDYIRLFVSVLLLISYNLVNMLFHVDALRFIDPSMFFPSSLERNGFVLSSVPFGGLLFRMLIGADGCCGFMQFGILIVFCCSMFSGFRSRSMRFRACSLVLILLELVGYVIGIKETWRSVYLATDVFFQLPLRYFILLWALLMVVLAKVIHPGRFVYIVLIVCVVDVFLVNPMRSTAPQAKDVHQLYYMMVNGEYAGKSFVVGVDAYEKYSSSVHSESGASYDYTNEYNGVSVDCSGNVGADVLTLPKLYYRGYKAVGENGEVFYVRAGDSNYCEVDIGGYTGRLRLEYRVPGVVLFFFFVQLACVARWLYCVIRSFVRGKSWRGFHLFSRIK